MLAYDLVATFALQFNLAPTEFVIAIKHATTSEPVQFAVYLALTVGIAALRTISLWLLTPHRPEAGPCAGRSRRRDAGRRRSDFFGHVSPHYHFGKMIRAEKPIESA